jgi:glycerol-3-phosphate dehydrogenase
MESRIYDVLVIGGGINGSGIARDAAGRGLSVLLCEQDDLASHTSSASTKLIHGGLRYLEYYEFGLVRKALREREVLLRLAPHIIGPLRFVMPHDPTQRPAWMIRAGLFLYDHLARRERLPGAQGVDFAHHPAGAALKPGFVRGFAYSDGWVQDARLVVLNALDASERGATILTRTACVSARRVGEHWHALLRASDGSEREVVARALVNAAGPWVERVIARVAGATTRQSVRLVKGSHIIVDKLFDHPCAYLFQNPDRRIIFALPYEQDFTLIGTTDVDYHGDPAQVAIDADEIRYLCDMSNRYFLRQIDPGQVRSSFSGVRPLLDDASASAASVTRDYLLERDGGAGAPMLSVFGGKITTYRKLAEQAVDRLAPLLGSAAGGWSASAPLPGGDIADADFERFLEDTGLRYPWLPEALRVRYAHAYGSRLPRLLAGADTLAGLGRQIVPGLYEAEARYLVHVEWARCADDILWRRTRLGLRVAPEQVAVLEAWLTDFLAASPPRPAAAGKATAL